MPNVDEYGGSPVYYQPNDGFGLNDDPYGISDKGEFDITTDDFFGFVNDTIDTVDNLYDVLRPEDGRTVQTGPDGKRVVVPYPTQSPPGQVPTSDASPIVIGGMDMTLPLVMFGGLFLLSQVAR